MTLGSALLLVSCTATAATAAAAATTAQGNPSVLIPGDGGSALVMQLAKPGRSPHEYCAKSTEDGEWATLWLDPKMLAPGLVDCWSENMKLQYDPETDTVYDTPGVTVRAVKDLAGLELDQVARVDGVKRASNSYGDLIDALVGPDGDTARDTTVRAAPYDFRRAPPGDPTFTTTELRAIVEGAFAAAGNSTKVTLLSHSLGCLNALYFLNTMTDEWKATYIHAWAPISPAYGGAVVDALQFVSGYNEGIPWLSGLDVRDEQRSYESNVWLLPSPTLWGTEEPLFTTPTKNYSAHDYAALFQDVGFVPAGPHLLRRTQNLTSAFQDPGVPTFPCYGLGVPTPVRYDYSDGPRGAPQGAPRATAATAWYDADPSFVELSSAGDGTVPQRSLEAGNRWASVASPESVLVVQGASHSGILSDPALISRVLAIVANATTAAPSATAAAAADASSPLSSPRLD